MKENIPAQTDPPAKQLQISMLAFFLIISFFSVRDLYADTLDECLIKALKNADYGVTVGELHEQCRQETGMVSPTQSLLEGPGVKKTGMQDESAPSFSSSNGPAEMVLKTAKARKTAYFPHKAHQDKYACGICHHGQDSSGRLAKYTAETGIDKCTACHNADMANEELNSFQSIGHKLCRECHKTHQDITSAKCSTCHP